MERRLPHSIYLQLQFLDKRGRDGWTFVNPGSGFSGNFQLEGLERDRYDSVEISTRHTFKGGHTLFASYTRAQRTLQRRLGFQH